MGNRLHRARPLMTSLPEAESVGFIETERKVAAGSHLVERRGLGAAKQGRRQGAQAQNPAALASTCF